MTAEPPMLLSIVTVCRNDLVNVRRTMSSLCAQTAGQDWEHILLDGASDDGTVDWYTSAEFDFPCRAISDRDDGIFDAMNKSLEFVNGTYVIFLNAGDIFADSGAIGRILERLRSEPVWGFSRARVVDEFGRKVKPTVGRIPYSRVMHLLGGAKICHQAVVMRVDFLEKLGRFDLSMGNAADYHLLLKAASSCAPSTWDQIDVEYLFGGISNRDNDQQLRRRHRARVEALNMNKFNARLDGLWTLGQLLRIRITKRLKPALLPLYIRLLN